MFNACTAELIKMATENRFIDCEYPDAVHVELITKLCCDYLNVESHLTKFRRRCRIYLTTPVEKRLSIPSDIIDTLEEKDIIRVGDYGKLKDLVRDIVDIVALIKEAEEKIKNLEEQSDSPKSKRMKIDDVSSKDEEKEKSDEKSEKDAEMKEEVKEEKEDKDLKTEEKKDESEKDTEKEKEEKKDDDGQSINNLRQRLIKINNDMTKVIPLSPLLERGEDELPIEQLYAQVVIQEDPKYKEKGHDSSHSTKEVTDPDDIFTKDGEAVKKIFMTGDSGRGKTTFCLWLLKNWCNALQKDGSDSEELDKWEKKLKEFDFSFLLQLGDFHDVQTNIASVIDMICQVVFESDTDHHATIRHVLSSNKYRSLIIIDGLDEYNQNKETRKHSIHGRLPTLNVSSTVSCFIAMRPWVLATMSKTVRNSDRVIEVFGLNEDGIKNVIKNVLLNRYKLKDDPTKCTEECAKIFIHFSEKKLKSFMQIPLLTVVCVQMLYEKKQLGDSMTSFYAEMLNMLIERANEKHKILEIGPDTTLGCKLPEILSKYNAIKKCTSVLLKLGKVAYAGVLSNETNITLEKEGLEEQISERDFLLNVGFISQREASSRTKKKVSIHFFHKSIQEFLAAVHIVTNKEVGDSFCKHLSDVDTIMELSSVIMFICGMCPSLGSVISQHVVSVTDSDTEICQYRESSSPSDDNRTVQELFNVQVSWYRELLDRRTDSPVKFYISDVLLKMFDNSIETVRVTKEVLKDHHVYARSLFLPEVYSFTDREYDTINKILCEFLSNKYNNTTSLVMVAIGCRYKLFMNGGYCISAICIPTLRTLYLNDVKTNNTHLDGNDCPSLLKNMPSLRVLEMRSVTLNDRGLHMSNMTSLQELNLSSVSLYERGLDLSNMTSLCNLNLCNVSLGERGLDLSGMTSLQELNLYDVSLGERGLDLSGMTSLQKLYLYDVSLCERVLDLSGMTSLRELSLELTTLGERGLHLSANMVHIEEVRLCRIKMSEVQWQQFINSLLNIQHSFKVELSKTNIDDESLTKMWSPDFIFDIFFYKRQDNEEIYFTRFYE